MDAIIFQVATWWGIGAIGGVLEWTNHRIMAGFCVIIVMVGFTATVILHDQPAPNFVAAKAGNDYHRANAVCVKNVHDPIAFATEDEAQNGGFAPCERCVLHLYDVTMRQWEEESEQ